MISNPTTDQEQFWSGQFGDDYSARNRGTDLIASNTAFFSRILSRTSGVQSVLELGANIGLNLKAIRQLIPSARLSAVELNQKASEELSRSQPDVQLTVGSILDYQPNELSDLVFTKGVLIHINPERLPDVYSLIHRASRRYVLIAEYYNPIPMEIPYRGHAERLFKRDFAGEMLSRFTDLSLVDYGFVYHKDPVFRQDDLTWFLMKKA